MKLTESDKEMIIYFWKEKRDLERWSQWEEKLPLIKEELPHLIDAMERLDSAERTLNAIIDSLWLAIPN